MREPKVALRLTAYPSLVLLAIMVLALFGNQYQQYVATLALGAVITAVALVLLVGLARIITLASGAMLGLGAYTVATLMVQFQAPFLLGVVAATFVGALGGLILGLPATRFRGHQLAMVTMVFQFVVIILISEWDAVTGGIEGLRVPRPSIAGVALDADWHFVVLIGLAAMVVVFVAGVLAQGSFGRCLRAISVSEVGAEAFGIYIAGYQVLAFVVSSAMIAFGGALFAPQLRILDPQSFGILASILMLAYPVVGGLTSIWGGVLGGSILSAAPEVLRFVAEYKVLVYTTLVIAVIVFFPGGLIQILGKLYGMMRNVGKEAGEETEHADEDIGPVLPARGAISRKTKEHLGSAVLRTVDLSKSYGSLAAVRNVNLEVASGTIRGLIGPNGAGKTTFFNMISGFLQPDAGSIEIFSRPMNGEPARNRIDIGVARTFQNVAIFGPLSCLDNVVIGLGRNGVAGSLRRSFEDVFSTGNSRQRTRLAFEALDAVGISHLAHQPAASLSLGNQRRVEIARAIVSQPKLILLDEPVSGLGPEEEEKLKSLLKRLNADFGVAMFLIEHNIRFVVDLCETLSVMSSGEIIAEGDPAEVIEGADVRRIYFGDEPT